MSGSLVLVHWQETEAKEMAKELTAAGWKVVIEHGGGTVKMKELRAKPPHAVKSTSPNVNAPDLLRGTIERWRDDKLAIR